MDRMKCSLRAALPLVMVAGLLVQSNIAFAHDPGRNGDNRGTSGCGGCHNGGTAGTAVAFGADTGSLPASVAANSVNTFTFTISGGPAQNAGLSVIASAGTLAVTATDSTIDSTGELIHTAASAMTGGSKTYTFTWTAPATSGPVTLTGAGVSGNANGSDTQDGAALITATIDVTGATTGPVVPLITGPSTGTVGVQVTFDSSTSTGAIVTRDWNFGDNGTTGVDATGITVTHTYAVVGAYTVTLSLIDDAGVTTTATHSITIADVGTTPPPTTGQELYDTNCASCHGPKAGPAGADGSVVGESAGDIREAIEEEPEMQYLSTLTPSEIFSIAIYLKKPSRGERLYNRYCAECHGPGGTGADEPAIVGASAALIRDEIINEPEMQFLAPLLEKEDAIQYIARFLGGASLSRSDLLALPDTSATDNTFLNKPAAKEPTPAAGALDWLTLMGVGAWGLSRRRKK